MILNSKKYFFLKNNLHLKLYKKVKCNIENAESLYINLLGRCVS